MRASRFAPLLLALALLLAVPSVVSAEEVRTGGDVVVGPNETVEDDLRVYAGSVEVLGTVDGSLDVYAGSVRVDGEVAGDAELHGGSVEVDGRVGGDLSAFGGSVRLGDSARVGGRMEGGASSLYVGGSVAGGAELSADSLVLGPSSSIGGGLRYSAASFDRSPGSRVSGAVEDVEDAEFGREETVFGDVLFSLYGLLVHLALGAVLLLVFPGFSEEVSLRARSEPLRSSGWGLLFLLAVPAVLVLVSLTLVGIPLALAGLFLYVLALWIGSVYGALSLGAWLLERVGFYRGRWAALAAGLVAVALLDMLPLVGGLAGFAVLLLGFGATVLCLREHR